MKPRPLPPGLACRPFTTAQAYAAGVGRKVLRGPAVRRLYSGLYVSRDVILDVPGEVAAAQEVLPPHTFVTGVTALWCYGVEIGEPHPLQFVTTHRHPVRRPGIHVTRSERQPPGRGGLVTPEHAFATAARLLDLVDLVSAGDWLVRRKLTMPERLVAFTATHRGAAAARARRAAALVRQRVDSPGETKLRLCLVLAGLPEPTCNITLGTDDYPIGTVDLLLEAYKVILEYEGDHHRTDKRQWNVDIGRVDGFTAEGYRVLRVTAEHMRRPRTLVHRVHAALVAGGYTGPAPVFTAEWSALFE